jgi:hypothetical protein
LTPGRGVASRETSFAEDLNADDRAVTKPSTWHCGHHKALYGGTWTASVPTLFEAFIEGEAVRIVLVGEGAWEVSGAGPGVGRVDQRRGGRLHADRPPASPPTAQDEF